MAKWREVIRHSLHRYCTETPTNIEAARYNNDIWAGNAATGGGYTVVEANWHVPCVLATTKPSYSAQWVGLAGYTSGGNLIQVGTEQNITSTGGTQYYGWWSDLNDPAHHTETQLYNVGCQDYMFAEADTTFVYLDDYTNNMYVSRSDPSYPGGNQSAEWIVERPVMNYVPTSLANFSPYEATFYNTDADQNTVFKNVGHTTHDSVYMCTDPIPCGIGSTLLANPTAISPDGSSFGVNWDASN